MQIGFVGLGQMGLPMFQNLVRVFPGALGYDASPERVAQTARDGVSVVTQPQHLRALDVVVTVLPHGQAVREALLGDGEGGPLAARLRDGAVVIDMSSSSPLDTKALAADLAALGVALVDAPVSGSVPKARAGTLTILVGGDDGVVERVQPLLAAMGTTLIRTGAVGSAHAMKALNNYVYAAGLLAASEAMLLARALALDPGIFVDVLNASSGRNVATDTKLRQHMLDDGDFKAGFGLRLMAKDLGIAQGLEAHAGFLPPQLALCAKLWQDASGALPAQADNTEIYRYLRDRLVAEPQPA